jgi:hypothetical protein
MVITPPQMVVSRDCVMASFSTKSIIAVKDNNSLVVLPKLADLFHGAGV